MEKERVVQAIALSISCGFVPTIPLMEFRPEPTRWLKQHQDGLRVPK